jgi:hypothetical protein
MSLLSIAPEFVSQAAADLEGIGSALGSANAAAAGSTTGVLAPAADEVSLAITGLFGAHAEQYQALSAQAARFHSQFVSILNSAAGTYLSTEVENAQQSLVNAVGAPSKALLGEPSIGTGAGAAASEIAASGAGGGAVASPLTGVLRAAAAAPAVGGAYQNLIANTEASLQTIGSTFANVTVPAVANAIVSYPQLIITSLETGNLLPLLNIPIQLATASATVTQLLTVPVSVSLISLTPPNLTLGLVLGLPSMLAFDALGAPVNAVIEAANSASAFATALQFGNTTTAIGALVDAPANIANGFLNGEQALSLDLQLPGVSVTANIPFNGLLAPLEPLTASVTVPGLPVIDTVTLVGPPSGGVVNAVVNGIPQMLADLFTV